MFPKQIRLVDEKVLEKVRGMGCCVCGQHPVDASHIRSRGAGGPDTMWNVVPHCRRHHTEWHARGWKDFIRRNPAMAIKLSALGWILEGEELTHPKMLEIATQIETPKQDQDLDPKSKSEVKRKKSLTSSL